jgi:hypothetical protein
MRRFLVLPLLIAICPSFSAVADDWGAPHPVSFHSRGFAYVAEIFPPASRQNPDKKPLCYFYEMGYPGTSWKIDAKLKWKAPLVNDLMPHQAVVSMEGRLVTLNEYGTLGHKNAVAIYSQSGLLVRTFQLEELIPAADMAKIETSESSRWWNKGAKYYFLEKPARLYVLLPWGNALEFFLDTGRFRYEPAARFSDLAKVLAKGNDTNEETGIWETSLRFSSVTDVVQAKGKQSAP